MKSSASSSPLRIGIQGVKASFHDVAARKYFGARGRPIELVECASFKILSEALATKRADVCLMAIENSIAGSILPNYSFLEGYGFKILGEVYLRIELSLMALPGQTAASLHTVQSHPMALHQCVDFLAAYPALRVIEASDTADSARYVAHEKLRGVGAIAAALAAREYGLEILAEGIESNKLNYTRFLVICRADEYAPSPAANKSSLRFETPHKSGSLARVLHVFDEHALNMTMLQSVPLLGRPYEYSFHVDLEWSGASRLAEALEAVKGRVTNLISFGTYERGEKPVV